MNADAKNCPKCGAVLPVQAAAGLCPACLMRQALEVTNQSDEATPSIIGRPVIRYFGNYELLEEIARGGMGVVYKARQVNLNRTVAVKTILTGQLADDEAVRRFHTEAEAAANLRHPNIVAIHEIGEQEGLHYFSMDYIEGRNLAQVAGGQPLAPARAAGYVRKIAEAIHFAHQRGTLHRDLKPSNVLIDERDEPRITDFGLAKVADADRGLTCSGMVLGTPNYMAPEQASGRTDLVGPASDVYALGAILYELLTGRPPFQGVSVQATLVQVVEGDPAPPRRLRADVPADLETICLKCLEKAPAARYASARELAEDLGRFLKHEPILARPISAARQFERWVKVHPALLAALAAFALLALSALSYGLWQQNRYLVWQAEHVDTERVAGPRTALVKALGDANGLLLAVTILAFVFTNKRLRGVPLRKLFDAHWMASRPVDPPTPRMLQSIEFAGLGLAAFGLFYLVKLIDAWAWEAYRWHAGIGAIYCLLYFGVMALLYVRRERQALRFGRAAGVIDARQVPPELRERVLALLRDQYPVDAIRLYRDTTGCTLRDARLAVNNLALGAGMIGIPAARIDAAKLLRNLAVTAVVLAIAGYFVTPAWRLPLLGQFGGGWLLMVALLSGLHLKGAGLRLTLTTLAFGLYVGSMSLAKGAFEAGWISFVGMFAGAALLLLAHRRMVSPTA